MGRHRKLAVSGVNVRISQPDKRDYPGLFSAIHRARRPVRVRGNDYLILTEFGNSDSERMPFDGVLGKFTDIPEDAEWLDTEKMMAANDEAKEAITIPESLKPNYQAFFCGLFPDEHVFVFETYSERKGLSVSHVIKWLRFICKSSSIVNEFGSIEIDIIPDYQILAQILSSDSIKELDIIIKKPNPDDYDATVFQAAEARLARLNAESEETKYRAPQGLFLELDDHTEALARVGAENGTVNAKIREDGIVRTVSTAEHPLEEQETYDPEVTPPLMMFRSLVQRVVGYVKQNRSD